MAVWLLGGRLDGGVAVGGKVSLRSDLAAATRPRSGPFVAHMGLGMATGVRACGGRFGRQGSGDELMGVGGFDASLLQHGRWGLAGLFRDWPGQGCPGRPYCLVRTATVTVPKARASRTTVMEVVPSLLASVLLLCRLALLSGLLGLVLVFEVSLGVWRRYRGGAWGWAVVCLVGSGCVVGFAVWEKSLSVRPAPMR